MMETYHYAGICPSRKSGRIWITGWFSSLYSDDSHTKRSWPILTGWPLLALVDRSWKSIFPRHSHLLQPRKQSNPRDWPRAAVAARPPDSKPRLELALANRLYRCDFEIRIQNGNSGYKASCSRRVWGSYVCLSPAFSDSLQTLIPEYRLAIDRAAVGDSPIDLSAPLGLYWDLKFCVWLVHTVFSNGRHEAKDGSELRVSDRGRVGTKATAL
jgi:hypothetical protein